MIAQPGYVCQPIDEMDHRNNTAIAVNVDVDVRDKKNCMVDLDRGKG